MSMIQNARNFGRHQVVRRKPTNVLRWITAALTAHRSRLDLNKLDDRLLEDIGVSRAEAKREAERPIWNVPAHWQG